MVARVVPNRRGQGGAALIIALIVIVLVSLIVVGAFNLSSSNLKSVENFQRRSEAITAANMAIESVVSSSFLAALNSTSHPTVDLDNDGTAEYTTNVEIPQCPLRVRRVSVDSPSGFEVDSTSSVSGTYIADYELRSYVKDSNTGASVAVREGVRVPLTESDYQTYVAASCGLTLITS